MSWSWRDFVNFFIHNLGRIENYLEISNNLKKDFAISKTNLIDSKDAKTFDISFII